MAQIKKAKAPARSSEGGAPSESDAQAASTQSGESVEVKFPAWLRVLNKTATPHCFPTVATVQFQPGVAVLVEVKREDEYVALLNDIDTTCGMAGASSLVYEITLADAPGAAADSPDAAASAE